MAPEDTRPTPRQVRVLVWIDDGCTEDRFTEGHLHKTRARALASRGLATVSRRQRQWQAKITDRGRPFLVKGTIPPRERTPRSKSSRRVPPTAAAPPAPSAARSTVGVERRKVNRPTSKASKTDLLIARVIAAGGDLHLDDDERGPHGVDAQVRTAWRLSKTPPGIRLHAYADIVDDPSHRCRSTPLETCAVVVDSVVGAVVVIRPRRPDPHPVADRSTGAHILRAIVPPERSAR